MKGDELSRYIGDIDDCFIDEAEAYAKPESVKHKLRVNRNVIEILCAAACFCLLIVGASVIGINMPGFGDKSDSTVEKADEAAVDDSAVDESECTQSGDYGTDDNSATNNAACDDAVADDTQNEAPAAAEEAVSPYICVIGNEASTGVGSQLDEVFSNDDSYRYRPYEAAPNAQRQIKLACSCIEEGCDFMIIDPASEDGWEEFLRNASDNHIQVIFVDGKVSCDESMYECWIGRSTYDKGIDSLSDVIKKVVNKLSASESVEKEYFYW